MTEYEMIAWHHRPNGQEFENLGDIEGQGSLGTAVHGFGKNQMT